MIIGLKSYSSCFLLNFQNPRYLWNKSFNLVILNLSFDKILKLNELGLFLLQFYISEIQAAKGKPILLNFLTMMAISDIIFVIVKGKRFEYDDPTLKRYITDLNFAFSALKLSGLAMVFPFLQ